MPALDRYHDAAKNALIMIEDQQLKFIVMPRNPF